MKKKMVCILMAGVMASLVPAQMVFAEGDSGENSCKIPDLEPWR